MGKHSRCVIYICDNDMQYPELHEKHSNRAIKAAWINTILNDRKQLIQESFHTFVTTSLLGWLINLSPVFNKINPSPVS